MALFHGGNVYEIASQLGCSPDQILDYSASINPLGPPPGLWELLSALSHRIQHYPDVHNRALLEKLAEYHRLPADTMAVGNGSTELIYWLPKALGIRRAIVVLPTFSEYRKAFELQGVELHKIIATPEARFQSTVEKLDFECDRVSPDAILFTNPGSPSGTLLSSSVREWIVRKSSGNDGPFCLVDEVFVDFCEQESLKGYLKDSPRLVVIRSMTKFYGIPGLRLGYVLTSRETAAPVRHFLPPWSVNTLAQIAGCFCFDQSAYREDTLKLVQGERDRMIEKMEDLGGISALPGNANYLLLKLSDELPPASVLCRNLLASNRILVRDCSSFEGLGDHYVRVAIRLPEENRRLLEGLKCWLESCAS